MSFVQIREEVFSAVSSILKSSGISVNKFSNNMDMINECRKNGVFTKTDDSFFIILGTVAPRTIDKVGWVWATERLKGFNTKLFIAIGSFFAGYFASPISIHQCHDKGSLLVRN